MKSKLAFAVLLVSAFLAGIVNGYDLHTRALTPVVERTKPAGRPLPFVSDGRLNFAIVIDRKAETRAKNNTGKSIAPAVEILQEAFEKTVGQKPVVLDEGEKDRLAAYPCLLLVGDSRLARAEAGIDRAKLPEQGFAVKTFQRGLAIVGFDSSLVEGWNAGPIDRRGTSAGTFYGAIDFTERFLGVRHYFPGEYGSLWPACRDLTVSPVHYEDAPYFKIRVHNWGYWCSMSRDELVAKWRTYMGDGVKTGDTSFLRYWRQGAMMPFLGQHCPQPQPYAKYHPDRLKDIFYTSPSGKFWYNPKEHIGNYFDVTNLKFADLLVEDYKKWFASNGKVYPPEMNEYSTANDVSFGVCDTFVPPADLLGNPTVKELNLIRDEDLKGRPNAVARNVFGRFFQYLGRSLERECPGKKLWLLAYYNAQSAPTDPRWKLPDNIEINLCLGGVPTKVADPAQIAANVQIAREWYEALGNRPAQSMWAYASRSDQFQRAIAAEFIGQVPKTFGKYFGRGSIFYDHDGGHDLWHFYYGDYCAEKSLWNPDFDVDAALDEHWVPFFGPKAGPHLAKFHALLKTAFLKYAVPSKEEVPQYPVGLIDEMEAELKAACAATAADSPEGRRVRLVADYWPEAFKTQRNRAAYDKPVYDVACVDAKTDWSKVPELPLIDVMGKGGEKLPVTVKLGWNERGLYGRLDSKVPPQADANRDCFNNDSIELFLLPGLTKAVQHQLVWDAAGHDWFCQTRLLPIPQPGDRTWRPKGGFFRPVVRVDGWTADFFVPFSSFPDGAPKPYDLWFANLVFTNRKDGGNVVRGTALTLGDHGNLNMYGYFRFAAPGDAFPAVPKKNFTLSNETNGYRLQAERSKPSGTERGTLQFTIANHTASGFDAIINWLRLNVDGVRSQDLELQPSPDGEYLLNFNGVRVRIRPYLKPGSPVLWCEVSELPGAKTAKAFRVSTGCVPSKLVKKGPKGETVVFDSAEEYARRIVKPAPGVFVFLDERLDGSTEEKGLGPCAAWADLSKVEKVTEHAGAGWVSALDFELKPGFGTFTFGVYERADVRTPNAEFLKTISDVMKR